MGQFLYYSHPSTCEIWTLVRHLLAHISHFRDSLVLFIAAIKFGGWEICLGSQRKSVYLFFSLEKKTISPVLPQPPDSVEVYIFHLQQQKTICCCGKSLWSEFSRFWAPQNRCSSFSQLHFIHTETGNSASADKRWKHALRQSERM